MAREKIKVIREEMLQVANNVAQEKNIEKDEVFGAMELALEKAARVKYGLERDIRVNINRENGDINLNSYLKVVETIDPENQKNEILLKDAKNIRYIRGHNEQGLGNMAIGYAKENCCRKFMAVTTSIGPGATNLVTSAALAHTNRIPVLFLLGDI